ncbi:hypothetical protein P7C65_04s1g06520 [Encephalitozoon intestinalis]|nr:hypothetical protein GPK93_04g06910 [Encephalitozoon intestinalis]
MILEATLEVFEEASLRVQKALTSMKEKLYKIDVCNKKISESLPSDRGNLDVKDYLTRICEVENEMERELKELVVFLDILGEEMMRDAENYKEMVSKAGIRSKLENISYLINKKMYLDEDGSQK